MLEVFVSGALGGLGAFLFGYLLLVIFRLISREGFLTKLLENELNTQVWEQPTERELPRGVEAGASRLGLSQDTGDANGDLISDSDLLSNARAQSEREASLTVSGTTEASYDLVTGGKDDSRGAPSSVVVPDGASTPNNNPGLISIIAFLLVAAVLTGFGVIQAGNRTTTTTERVVTLTERNSVRSDSPVNTDVSGNAEEQVNQGLAYYHGRDVAQNYAEAARLFRLAANQGNSNAQNNLGFMYENGFGVPKDYVEAVRLYQLAANQGNSYARENLSRFAAAFTAPVANVEPQAGLNEGDCIDISLSQGMGAGERCRAQIAGRPQAGLNEGDCIDISLSQGMGAGERCRAQIAGRPQAGLNEGDCIDISLAQGMGAGERCRAQVRAGAARY